MRRRASFVKVKSPRMNTMNGVTQIIDKLYIGNRLFIFMARKKILLKHYSVRPFLLDLTSKPLATLKQISLAKCYQIVIKSTFKMLQTRINTGSFRNHTLLKLFFGFDFSYESSNFMFANHIILIRFCVLFIWLNFWCTQIVPILFPCITL